MVRGLKSLIRFKLDLDRVKVMVKNLKRHNSSIIGLAFNRLFKNLIS